MYRWIEKSALSNATSHAPSNGNPLNWELILDLKVHTESKGEKK